jgi:hypothetical protein
MACLSWPGRYDIALAAHTSWLRRGDFRWLLAAEVAAARTSHPCPRPGRSFLREQSRPLIPDADRPGLQKVRSVPGPGMLRLRSGPVPRLARGRRGMENDGTPNGPLRDVAMMPGSFETRPSREKATVSVFSPGLEPHLDRNVGSTNGMSTQLLLLPGTCRPGRRRRGCLHTAGMHLSAPRYL